MSQTKIHISGPTQLIENLDQKIIDKVRTETGMKLTRSGLLKTLIQITLDATDHLDVSNVYDESSLQAALKKAFKNI